ncbi:MAG: RteC domain-containing protein [Prevotellaceae bacterium]|jgi:benzoyl-CoA reductase/2-hydroxyglutaryl-CoA dehydratase subunit BcrC/BadD/HgdB|nr:RteC domain-containing protein [Prevotellaceae bacterium]
MKIDALMKNEMNSLSCDNAIIIVDMKTYYVDKQEVITKILNDKNIQNTNNIDKRMQWTGTKMEFIELIYALKEAKVINNGNTTLKEIFEILGNFLNFKVLDYYRYFTSIINRTGDRTIFLDKLKKVACQKNGRVG